MINGASQPGLGRRTPGAKNIVKPKRQESPALTSFFLSDSSPMIQYSSASTSGWTTGYALQSDGWDSTVHITIQPDSKVTFDITATSLTLLIPFFDNCTSTLTLNASAPIPACATPFGSLTLQNLPRGLHRVEYDTNTLRTGQEVSFWGVDATRPYDGVQWGNVTIDDAQKGGALGGLKYNGDWTLQTGLAGMSNKTLSGTSKKGDSVEFVGKGSAIYLYGNTGPQYSSASITLDDTVVAPMLNFSAGWTSTYQLLWFRTGLDTSKDSKVVMTNLEGKALALDFVVLTANQNDTNSSIAPTPFLSKLSGKIVIFLLAPLVGLILLAALIFFIIRRRRQSSRSANPSSRKDMRNHDSFQNLRKSYLDFGGEMSPPHSGSTDHTRFHDQQQQQQQRYGPPSAKSAATDMVYTYEEEKKRHSDQRKTMVVLSPAHSAYVGASPTTSVNPLDRGTVLGLPSPALSPLGFNAGAYIDGAKTPTSTKRWSRSSFLRPFDFIIGKPLTRSSTLLSPNPRDTNLAYLSPTGTPSTAGASEAELAHWSKATSHIGHLHPHSQSRPISATSPLYSHTLSVTEWDRSPTTHPYARFRPSDGPSGRTSISFSDVMSVLAAPPSERGIDQSDFSVHTGRSGPNGNFFVPGQDAPPVPSQNTDFGDQDMLLPMKYNTPPLRTGSRPPPSAFPLIHRPTIPLPESPLTPRPARPESTTNVSLPDSPGMETADYQYQYERARNISMMSKGSEYTAISAARPDSEVIPFMPFDEFVNTLREGQKKVKEDRERDQVENSEGVNIGKDGPKWGRI